MTLNRKQCSTSNPCSKYGSGLSGCLTDLKPIGIGDHKLLAQAADGFIEMLKSMPADIKSKINLTDTYRTLEVQCKIFDFDYYEKTGKRRKKGTKGTPVARPGSSNHGWGRAIDIWPESVQNWIKTNGTKFGWCWGEVKSEPWHFTFCGGGPNRSQTCNRICGSVKGDSGSSVNSEKPKQDVSSSDTPKIVGLSQNFYKGSAASNIEVLINKLKSKGITNPMVQAAILSVIGKESGFIPQNEKTYCSSTDSRIVTVFGKRGRKCKKHKCDDPKFFECVYGKDSGATLGNTEPGDGYKFSGRGFNQITGRGNYKAYGYESNPDSLNDVEGAATAAVNFLAKEGSSLNDRFKTPDEAVEFFTTRNAGGVRKPDQESKSKQVLARFNFTTETPTSDIPSDQLAQSPSGEKKPEGKKSLFSLLGLGDLEAMIAMARGDEEAFDKATKDLPNELPTDQVNEEVDRIRDIIRKVL